MLVTAPSRSQEFINERDELEALIEEARWRARRRRRRHGAAIMLTVLTGAAVYVLIVRGADRLVDPQTGPPTAAVAAPQLSRAGRYWYVRRIATVRRPLPMSRGVARGDRKPQRASPVWIDIQVSDETWIGVDGTMREREVQLPRFASVGERVRWRAAGMPPLAWFVNGIDTINIGGGRFPAQLSSLNDGLFTYRQLVFLPTAVVSLRDRLGEAQRAFQQRAINASVPPGKAHHEIVMGRLAAASRNNARAISDLQMIGDLLASPVPERLRRALGRVAATIPGVHYTPYAHDSVGRAVVTVSASGAQFSPVRLVLDPASGLLLGGPDETSARGGPVVAQGLVDSTNAVPKGVKPITGIKPEDAGGEPPEPQTLSISPAAGNARTVFEVKLPAPARPMEPGPAQPRLGIMLTGPISPRGCSYGGAWPTIPQLSSGARTATAGIVTYSYRLNAPIGNGGWCKGRYQLQVIPKLGNDGAARGFETTSTIGFQVR
jgi:hypothetical protein